MNARLLTAVLLLAATVHRPAVAQRQDDTTFSPDRFGYTIATEPECPRQWIDTTAGTLLVPQAAAGATATDDGAASWPLVQPFEFYGQLERDLIVSTNGYLAFAADTTEDDGGDWRNGCPLPKVPENNATRLGRIVVLHDDLAGANGTLHAQFFAPCPRPGAVNNEPCSVVEWNNWGVLNGPPDGLGFQAVLYHESRAIVLQYADPLPATDGATIGLQQQELQAATNPGCNQSTALPPTGALCLNYPWPPEVLLIDGMENRFPVPKIDF